MKNKKQTWLIHKVLQGMMLLAIFLAAFGAWNLPVVRAQAALTAVEKAETSTPITGYVLSNGQFVYGPNVKDFNIRAYLEGNAPHLLKYADDLYGRSEYFSINPKVYLTLLEVHAHLISNPDSIRVENPFDLPGMDFISQIDDISSAMNAAYYLHLYSYSSLPALQRNLPPFTTQRGAIINVASDTNAGTYAIIAALARTESEQNISRVLDHNQPDGFYQTFIKLFGNDDPIDEKNHIYLPGEAEALAAPIRLLQLPYLRGETWKFGGVHDNGGGGGSGSPFTDASAMDFYPGVLAWGADTSNMWVTASAPGTPSKIAACYFKIAHADGWETTYYHLENIQNFSGSINQNDKIGVIANTLAEATCTGGAASGPHVHFTLKRNGALVAINGTPLSGWYVHAGRWNYDTDPNYMWLEKDGIKKVGWEGILNVVTEAPVILKSIAANDGWILESTETSNKGGTLSAKSALRVGDDAANKQYRSILYFDTTSLPDNATITKVTLKIKKSGLTGTDPFKIRNNFLLVDIRTSCFGLKNLQITDFQATASKANVGRMTPVNGQAGWYQMVLGAANYHFVNPVGVTQFRLRFAKDDNHDFGADFVSFYAGDAAAALRPVLTIEYTLP